MRARLSSLIGGAGAVALVAGLVVGLPATAQAAVSPTAAVVINEVYGGGGNAGATYKRDFIELYNTSDTAVPLAGWSVQYASATGAFSNVDALEGTIPAHAYWIVAESAGTGGTVDVPNDEPAPGTLAMSGTGGKVLLARTTTAQNACATTCAAAPDVVDLVGWGTTTTGYSGSGAAPATTNSTSVSRNDAHANTTDNAADFTAGTRRPRAAAMRATRVTRPRA